jgi:molybdopterin-guanine dinucleotide biosynthesis adapter protein
MSEVSGKRVIGVVGFKNAGKTTLIEKLVRDLTATGYRISTVKHAHHSFDIDVEGKDSFRHRNAGASDVVVVSHERLALMREFRGGKLPSLRKILDLIDPCDLVIVEGYKRDNHDKIEVRNLALDHPRLAGDDPTVVAIASNGAVNAAAVPVFDRDNVSALAQFIVGHCRLDAAVLALRRAGPADASAIRRLTRNVYAKWIPVIGREPLPMIANYEKVVTDHWIDVASQDGQLIALIEMIPRAHHLMIENIAVATDQQGRGIARQLIEHSLTMAKTCGLAEVRLLTNSTFASNVALYVHLGFEQYDETAFPGGGTTAHFRKSVS